MQSVWRANKLPCVADVCCIQLPGATNIYFLLHFLCLEQGIQLHIFVSYLVQSWTRSPIRPFSLRHGNKIDKIDICVSWIGSRTHSVVPPNGVSSRLSRRVYTNRHELFFKHRATATLLIIIFYLQKMPKCALHNIINYNILIYDTSINNIKKFIGIKYNNVYKRLKLIIS